MANDRIGKPKQKMQSLRPATKSRANVNAPKAGVANAMANQLQKMQDKTSRPGYDPRTGATRAPAKKG